MGHISKEVHSVNNLLNKSHFLAQLITVKPSLLDKDYSKHEKKGDFQIMLHHIEGRIQTCSEALVIRTLPNSDTKTRKNYNNTNWPYLSIEAAKYIRDSGVKNLFDRLKKFNCILDLYDPWANSEDIKKVYNVDPVNTLKKNTYDGLLITVAHD